MSTFTTSIQHCIGSPSNYIKAIKMNEDVNTGKEEENPICRWQLFVYKILKNL